MGKKLSRRARLWRTFAKWQEEFWNAINGDSPYTTEVAWKRAAEALGQFREWAATQPNAANDQAYLDRQALAAEIELATHCDALEAEIQAALTDPRSTKRAVLPNLGIFR